MLFIASHLCKEDRNMVLCSDFNTVHHYYYVEKNNMQFCLMNSKQIKTEYMSQQ